MSVAVLRGDARSLPLPDASVDLVVTSPPYFALRSYTDGGEHYGGQIGSEATPAEWLAALVACTAEWARVLKPSGSIFVNLGDKYAGSGPGDNDFGGQGARDGKRRSRPGTVAGFRPKSLMGLPWRYAIATTDQLGLILRRDIIWSKPNGLPESVTDRCQSAHEYVFHLVKQPRYYAAVDEIREPHTWKRDPATQRRTGANGANPDAHKGLTEGGVRSYTTVTPQGREYNPLGKLPGSVWDIPTQPLVVPDWLNVIHFAAFPMELPRRIILGWSPAGVCTACGEGRRPVSAVELGWESVKRITGYVCTCPEPTAPARPAVVLDPFGGSGTTALVAAMYGRHGITVDLSADYCRLAAWRTTDPAQRAAAAQVRKPPPVPAGQMTLNFEEDW